MADLAAIFPGRKRRLRSRLRAGRETESGAERGEAAPDGADLVRESGRESGRENGRGRTNGRDREDRRENGRTNGGRRRGGGGGGVAGAPPGGAARRLPDDADLPRVGSAGDPAEAAETSRSSRSVSAGHEAVTAAAGSLLRPGTDWAFLYYRDRALATRAGLTPAEQLAAAWGAAADPASGGRQMPSHFVKRSLGIAAHSSCVGTQFLHAVGVAYAERYLSRHPVPGLPAAPEGDGIALVCGGDGSTSEGEFWGGAEQRLPPAAAGGVPDRGQRLRDLGAGGAPDRRRGDRAARPGIPRPGGVRVRRLRLRGVPGDPGAGLRARPVRAPARRWCRRGWSGWTRTRSPTRTATTAPPGSARRRPGATPSAGCGSV